MAVPVSGYDKLIDGPWPLGAVAAGSVDAIPPGAVNKLFDAFWPEGDSLPVRRGGSTYKNAGAFGTGGIHALWDGYLAGGRRTVFAAGDSFGVLDTNDSSNLSLATPVVAGIPRIVPVARMVAIEEAGLLYGGSRKAANYAANVNVTNGSVQVLLPGGGFTANVDAGMLASIASSTSFNQLIPVAQIVGDTQADLAYPFASDTEIGASAVFYRTYPLATLNIGVGASVRYGSAGGRLLWSSGSRLRMTYAYDVVRTDADDFHEFDGEIIGIGNVRDTAIVFTTAGVYAVYGIALDLTAGGGSPQRRQETVSSEMTLWGAAGIASWKGTLIVPALDGVWLLDAVGAPTKISGSFDDVYAGHVRAGYQPGIAEVHEGHYLLPVLNGTTPVDLLSCRLTPNAAGQAMLWAQSRGHGGGGTQRVLTQRPSATPGVAPLLLGGGSDGRISTLHHFEPAAAYKSDANGVAHVIEMHTRAFPTGGGVVNTVRFVTLYYELTDAAADNPTFTLSYAIDGSTVFTAAAGSAPESSGTIAKKTFVVNKDARVIQFRVLHETGPAASAKIHGLELQIHRSDRV